MARIAIIALMLLASVGALAQQGDPSAPAPAPAAPGGSTTPPPAATDTPATDRPAADTPPADAASPDGAPPSAEAPPAAQPGKKQTESIPFNKADFKNDPLIQKALEVFKGQIIDVRA